MPRSTRSEAMPAASSIDEERQVGDVRVRGGERGSGTA